MRTKAKFSFAAAEGLAKVKNYNGAANRAYYALYQALVWRWEEDGFRAEDQDRSAKEKLDKGLEPSWSHSFVCNNLSKMKLSRIQEQVVRTALGLRVKADYTRDSVHDEIEEVIKEIPAIFEQLKVGK